MSLRRKLILFFLGTVVLPVFLLAYLLIDLSQDSRQEQTDANLRAGMLSVNAIYDTAGQIAPGVAERLAERLAPAVRSENKRAARRVLREELRLPIIAGITVRDEEGDVLADGGPELTLARAEAPIRDRAGRPAGTVEVTTIEVEKFLSRIEEETGQVAAIVRGDAVVAATAPIAYSSDNLTLSTPDELTSFEIESASGEDRAAALDLAEEPDDAHLLLMSSTEGSTLTDPLTVIGSLALLLITVLAIATLFLNRLRRRLNDMLEMTRRTGRGDFSGELSEDGNDEMAELAQEINRMRGQISMQIEELRSQRRELDQSVRRLGEAFASGLDREALLEVLLQTAVAACGAQSGRLLINWDGGAPTAVTIGTDPGGLEELLGAASEQALHGSEPIELADAKGGAHAIAERMFDPNQPQEQLCVLAVAREGEEFTEDEQELLRYLIAQSAISIENIVLHEQVATQAVTDDLTGLANHRALNAWIEREVQRVRRYGEPLSLLMIDVDEFKRINDTCGHLAGDHVLREVAGVIKRVSRGVDEAARYGGDEFVVALPDTDTGGAAEVAERIRAGVAEIPTESRPISVSVGVASTEDEQGGATELIAAADRALYRAKADGKDRVQIADRV